jgi:hypothetical protein
VRHTPPGAAAARKLVGGTCELRGSAGAPLSRSAALLATRLSLEEEETWWGWVRKWKKGVRRQRVNRQVASVRPCVRKLLSRSLLCSFLIRSRLRDISSGT